MRLTSFRVVKFRNVVDSGPVDVQPDVTCLVGKNEAGKTAILQALRRLNPATVSRFSVEEDYPRWLWITDRKAGDLEQAVPIRATFALDDDDHAAVAARVGPDVLISSEIRVARNNGNERTWAIDIDESQAVKTFVGHEQLRSNEIGGATTFEALKTAITDARNAEGVDEATTQRLDSIISSADELLREGTIGSIVREVLEERLPLFFFFSEYSILPGRIDLEQLAGEEDPGASALQTIRALLKMADTDPNLLGTPDYESRKAELEAVSNELTRQVFEYWTQNKELQVSIDVDARQVEAPPGVMLIHRYLDIRVRDKRHEYTGNFGQRSSGFQWFFSFLAAFSEFENYDRPVIVLLDEPALGLHARAQADFLRFINERLAATSQVIYTTHSPFMIDTGRLDRVRIVEDHGPELGSQVTSDIFSTDSDSLFPLQAALGWDIAQSLFIGPDNLLLEGTSDYTYLTVVSDFLKSLGRTGLDERWTPLPTGGASNIATFVALLGGHLGVSVVIDSSTRGAQKLTDLARRGLLQPHRLVTIGEIVNATNADTEDLFTPGDYLRFYNPALHEERKVAELPPGDRIVKRLAALRPGDFDHGLPAGYLLRNRDDLLPKLSATTLDNYERLFRRINETLPST